MFLIVANENGTEEDPTKAFNKFNMNVKTTGLVQTSVFTDDGFRDELNARNYSSIIKWMLWCDPLHHFITKKSQIFSEKILTQFVVILKEL